MILLKLFKLMTRVLVLGCNRNAMAGRLQLRVTEQGTASGLSGVGEGRGGECKSKLGDCTLRQLSPCATVGNNVGMCENRRLFALADHTHTRHTHTHTVSTPITHSALSHQLISATKNEMPQSCQQQSKKKKLKNKI